MLNIHKVNNSFHNNLYTNLDGVKKKSHTGGCRRGTVLFKQTN